MLPVCKEEGEIRKQIYLQILPKKNTRRVNQKLIKLGTHEGWQKMRVPWLLGYIPLFEGNNSALNGERETLL